MTSEGDTATQEVPVSLPAAKVEETGDVLDSGFSLEDAMPKTSGAKNGKKGFLVDSDSKDPLYTSDEWRVQNFKVTFRNADPFHFLSLVSPRSARSQNLPYFARHLSAFYAESCPPR